MEIFGDQSLVLCWCWCRGRGLTNRGFHPVGISDGPYRTGYWM